MEDTFNLIFFYLEIEYRYIKTIETIDRQSIASMIKTLIAIDLLLMLIVYTKNKQ